MRAALCETLLQVGRADACDAAATGAALAAVRGLLAMCASHVDKESRYLHPAIEARARGASERVAGDHEEHLQAIADLDEDVRVAEAASADTRDAALPKLYRNLSLFVAGNLEHMIVAETAHNAALWAGYTDEELTGIHDRLLASIAPAEMTGILRWMVPSVTAGSRAAMFAGLRAQMPPPMFAGLLDCARSHLAPADRDELDRALARRGRGTDRGGVPLTGRRATGASTATGADDGRGL